MPGRIFHLTSNGDATPLEEQRYDAENVLQQLLAEHPDLLAGDQIDEGDPRRWLLVSREMGIPGEDGGAAIWSLDHLFLDQDGIPTLVEVKRSTDTRIRREVVGQMLDYAANAVAYWPVEQIRAAFESQCERNDTDPDEELAALVEDGESGEFWQQVKTNLQAGRIRMLFVADAIPQELRQVVEFLNGQMDPAEVLAVEIRQFVGGEMKTLVPRVIGQIESARRRKGTTERQTRKWNRESFLQDLSERQGDEGVRVATRLLDWTEAKQLRIWWGEGLTNGSFLPLFDNGHGDHFLFSVWTYGTVEIQFQHMKKRPFDDVTKRRELADRLSTIDGVSIPESRLTKRPSIPLARLAKDEALACFTSAFDWCIEEIKAVEGGS